MRLPVQLDNVTNIVRKQGSGSPVRRGSDLQGLTNKVRVSSGYVRRGIRPVYPSLFLPAGRSVTLISPPANLCRSET